MGNLLDKIQHDSLGDHIDYCPLDNVVVGGNEQLYNIVVSNNPSNTFQSDFTY